MWGDDARRKRLSRNPPHRAIVAVLLATGLCASFLFTLVVPIQSRLPELLNASRENTAWVLTATLLVSAIATPISGRLGDMYGKRRVILALLAVTLFGSLIIALSSDIAVVITGRALQGAMAGVIPLGIAVMRDVLPVGRVDSAIATMSATLGVGSALGLPFSAFITQYADWHALFWIATGLCALAFFLVLWVVPVSVMRTEGRFDFLGAIGLSAILSSILLVISQGEVWGWASPTTLLVGLGGVVGAVLWGWYQLRVTEPLLDLRVATRRPVLLTNLSSIALGFALFSSNIVYPQMLEQPESTGVGFGLPLFTASLIIMPLGIVMMLLSPVAGRLARVTGPKLLLVIGAASLIVAYGFSIFFHHEVWQILVVNVIIGIGIGFGYASMPMLIMRSVPQSKTGASNGLNALCRSLGTSSAAAVLGAVLATSSAESSTGMPTASGFQHTFVLGIIAAGIALIFALLIPQKPTVEQRPSIPEGR